MIFSLFVNNPIMFYFNYISGEVLAIEKPYAGVLRRESYEFNCQNCFKRCLNGIPCLKCTLVRIYNIIYIKYYILFLKNFNLFLKNTH